MLGATINLVIPSISEELAVFDVFLCFSMMSFRVSTSNPAVRYFTRRRWRLCRYCYILALCNCLVNLDLEVGQNIHIVDKCIV